MSPVLECRNFSFYYDKHRVLDNISFCLDKGGWLSIIGPNGSGKSTLLKNLLRLVDGRSDGEIRVNDCALGAYSQKELARLLSYVPQASGRVPPFTVREFMNLSRYPFSFGVENTDSSEIIERALGLTNTANIADRRMDKLSGGQRQGAFLAAALAQNTAVLLLDEPASFLDPRHAFALNELLKSLHEKNGLTIIIVTHDLSLPFYAGGLVLALKEGRQQYFGDVEHIRTQRVLEKTFMHEFSYIIHPRTGRQVVLA